MNRTMAILAIAFALRASGDDGVRVAMRFNDAPVEQVAAFYCQLTGNQMAIETGVYATVTLVTQEEVTREDAARLIKEALLQQNVGVFPLGTNTVVAKWADPIIGTQRVSGGVPTVAFGSSGMTTNGRPRMSYQVRRRERDRVRLEGKGLAHPTNAAHQAEAEKNPNNVPNDTARPLADPQR
jgi:type II secretory pathway component GspD/PulD (secretin)